MRVWLKYIFSQHQGVIFVWRILKFWSKKQDDNISALLKVGKTRIQFFMHTLKLFPVLQVFSLNLFLLIAISKNCFQMWSNIEKCPYNSLNLLNFNCLYCCFWVETASETAKLAILEWLELISVFVSQPYRGEDQEIFLRNIFLYFTRIKMSSLYCLCVIYYPILTLQCCCTLFYSVRIIWLFVCEVLKSVWSMRTVNFTLELQFPVFNVSFKILEVTKLQNYFAIKYPLMCN